LPAAILRDLGIKRVRLLSNNPRKASALAAHGVEVVVQLTCEAASNPHSFAYLQTKKERMGHALSLRQAKSSIQTRDLHAVRLLPTATADSGSIGSDPNRTADAAWRTRRLAAQG
jgi:hypothetical protein